MVKPKRLSQAAIAKATGLSRATVSLVLRGGTGPSEATQAKVLAAAARMGYQRNDLVLSIRSGKSKTVGVLAEPYDSHWRDICYGIHDRLIESNHLPLFLWNNHRLPVYTEDYGCQQIQRLLSRWVDGVILWPFFADLYAKHLHEFQNRNIPVVIIDHANPQVVADSVQSDEAEIAELIVGHLCGLEHREILLVSGPAGVGWADKRSHAIHAELAKVPGAVCHEVRITLPPTLSHEPKMTEDAAELIADTLRNRPGITATIASTDLFARAVYMAAGKLDWGIPERLSVIGVADLNFAAIMAPPLTTIRQDGYAIGRQAAQIELERSAGLLSGPPRVFQVGSTLIERQSTARRCRL